MSDIESFVNGLLGESGDTPDRLVQHLCSIQHRYSYVPEAAIQLLADRLRMPKVEIVSIIWFYAFLHTTPRGDFDIRFSDNITDRMLGSQPLLDSMCRKLGVETGVPRADGRVCVGLTSCSGLCDQGPALLVNGLAVSRLDEDRVHRIVGLVEAGIPVNRWPKTFFVIEDNIRRRDKLLDGVITRGSAIETFAVKGADALLETIARSGLRGRGGAGFKTATKWRLCRDAPAQERYVVCNADEGEPGTFKDRILLNSYANVVVEGMTICAGIVGARKGFLYLRGEYLYLRPALEKLLRARRDAGLLGENILGRAGFDFDIEIHMGAGAYICGEDEGWYRVGPLARVNNCDFFTTPLAEAERKEFKTIGNALPVQATMAYHWARLIELLHCTEAIARLLDDPDLSGNELRTKGAMQSCGTGVIEAPRGTLFHHYEIDEEGLVRKASLIVSTTNNNQAMNESIRSVASQYLDGRRLTEALLNQIEVAIRACDPCLSCATHAIGKMPLEVILLDANGAPIDRLEKRVDGRVVRRY